MDEKEFPEWYRLVWQVLREFEVFDNKVFTDIGGYRAMAQLKYAAERDAKRTLQENSACCSWTCDDDGIWTSECGDAWTFEDGGPAENHMKYCPFCGRKMEARAVAPQEEEEEDEDDH